MQTPYFMAVCLSDALAALRHVHRISTAKPEGGKYSDGSRLDDIRVTVEDAIFDLEKRGALLGS